MSRLLFGIAVMVAGLASLGVARAQPSASLDWSGFYVGGGVGATAGDAGATAAGERKSSGNYFTATDFGQITDAGDGNLWQGKASGGIQIGYGRQFGHVLVGIEASANTLSLNESRTRSQVWLTQPAERFYLHQRVEADWQATVRPRLGWAQDNWLAYVTGGLAVTQVTLDVTLSDTYGNGAYGHSANTEIEPGWTIGFGGEYALDRHWSLRGDYLYADFGTVDTSSVVTNSSYPTTSSVLDSSAELRTHTLLVGLTYRFN